MQWKAHKFQSQRPGILASNPQFELEKDACGFGKSTVYSWSGSSLFKLMCCVSNEGELVYNTKVLLSLGEISFSVNQPTLARGANVFA